MTENRRDFAKSHTGNASARPTASGFLTLARVAALGTAILAGYSLATGTWSEAYSTGGVLCALPFLIAVVVGLLLASLWHTALGYAAHAETVAERSLGASFGAALSLVGIGCSGWFLATLLGGNAALQDYRLAYLGHLRDAQNIVAANGTIESTIVDGVARAASTMTTLADDEGASGQVSGKPGKHVVYNALQGAAQSFGEKAEALADAKKERDAALKRSRDNAEAAVQAAAAGNGKLFQSLAAKAATELTDANAIHFDVTDLGLGLDLIHAKTPIDQALRDVSKVVTASNEKIADVDIPAYQPIDAKRAIVVAPQPLAWLTAIVIDALPLLFLGLLLTVWRRPPPRTEATSAEIVDLNARRALPSLTSAE